MTAHITRRSIALLAVTFALYVILEASGVGMAFAFYAILVGVGWLALAFSTVWRKTR